MNRKNQDMLRLLVREYFKRISSKEPRVLEERHLIFSLMAKIHQEEEQKWEMKKNSRLA